MATFHDLTVEAAGVLNFALVANEQQDAVFITTQLTEPDENPVAPFPMSYGQRGASGNRTTRFS